MLNNHYFSIGTEEYEYVNGTFFKKVDSLTIGGSFGEVALQNQCSQNYTIKTEAPCEFAILTKDNYTKYISGIRQKMELEKIQFLKTQPAFKNLTYGKVLGILWALKEVKYYHGSKVYAEGELADAVFIL